MLLEAKIVKEIKEEGKKYFQCEECKFLYKDRGWAEKCEAWCKEHKSCNLSIIKNAIQE